MPRSTSALLIPLGAVLVIVALACGGSAEPSEMADLLDQAVAEPDPGPAPAPTAGGLDELLASAVAEPDDGLHADPDHPSPDVASDRPPPSLQTPGAGAQDDAGSASPTSAASSGSVRSDQAHPRPTSTVGLSPHDHRAIEQMVAALAQMGPPPPVAQVDQLERSLQAQLTAMRDMQDPLAKANSYGAWAMGLSTSDQLAIRYFYINVDYEAVRLDHQVRALRADP